MFDLIEKIKYGEGLRIKLGSYALTFERNLRRQDFPKILKRWFKKRTGKNLNLNNPQTYNEKIQWLKLYDNSPLKTKLSDKYLVREWVKEQIGEEYLIPLLGVWDNFDDIDFDKLPEKFVLKANHGSHWNIIVKDKSKFDKIGAKKKFDKWMKRNYAVKSLELQYKDIEPKIIAEKYMEDSKGELNDYKILCFNGKPEYVWIDCGRYSNHTRNIYDLSWNLQPFTIQFPTSQIKIEKPEHLDKMTELAKKLCRDFAHVRVDFYCINGKIYFGEMTFTSGSGIEKFIPEKYDFELGNKLILPEKKGL